MATTPARAARNGRATRKNFQRDMRRELRRTRRELRLSQTAMGKILGKSRDTVSRVERGELTAPAGLAPLLGRLQKMERDRAQVLREIAADGRRLAWGD